MVGSAVDTIVWSSDAISMMSISAPKTGPIRCVPGGDMPIDTTEPRSPSDMPRLRSACPADETAGAGGSTPLVVDTRRREQR